MSVSFKMMPLHHTFVGFTRRKNQDDVYYPTVGTLQCSSCERRKGEELRSKRYGRLEKFDLFGFYQVFKLNEQQPKNLVN